MLFIQIFLPVNDKHASVYLYSATISDNVGGVEIQCKG